MNKLSFFAALVLIAFASPAHAQKSVGGSIPFGAGAAPMHNVTVIPAAQQATFNAVIPGTVTTTVLPTHAGFFPKDFIDPIYLKGVRDKREYNSKGIKEVPHIAINSGARGANFHAAEGSQWTQISSNEVRLNEGAVLLSLHGPAAAVETANGKVTVKGEGNVLTSYIAGVMRVENITARGVACKVELNGKAINAADNKTLALAPGYELVVGDRSLAHGEIRPADGIARRAAFVFEGSHIAVNEFSVDSVLDTHPIVAAMRQDTNKQDGKTLDQMCKMAAVMNWVHGAGGYKPAEGTGIAGIPGRETK